MKRSLVILSILMTLLFAVGGNIQMDNAEPRVKVIQTVDAQETEGSEGEQTEQETSKSESEGSPVPVPEDPEKLSEELPTKQFVKALVKSIGGIGGLSTMGIIAVLVQLLMMFFRTPLASFAGKWKLLVVYGLSLLGGVLGLVAFQGLDWTSALIHSNTLAAAQITVHQAWKQFVEKGNEDPA